MASRMRSSGSLFEFLEEAELQQHFSGLKNILQVHTVQQLKYVHVEDLYSIGMSKPEARRLKTFYSKVGSQFGSTYASKLKRLLLPSSKTAKRDFLLGPDGEDVQLRRGPAAAGGGRALSLTAVDGAGLSLRGRHASMSGDLRVPGQHIIPSESISVYKELGSGEFGVVQQGVWTDDDQLRHQVAVKCLSKDRINNTLEFMKEYDIMHSLDHPNIVRVFGVVLNAPQIMLITELAPLRSLLECLKEPSLRTTFTVSCLSSFAVQICQGMSYLESKRLIHRDLAARNILVFSKSSVKISDFGLSRALGVDKDYYRTNFNVNLKLPIAWCAPESINFLKFTSASDVWAFGVTLWEMYSYGFQPWAAQTGHQILDAISEPNYQRLEQPLHCPREHYAIMLQCWHHEPSKRPVFEALVAMLEEAKPEQVKVVVAVSKGTTALNRDMLEFDVGDIITVLDKHSQFWSGALSSGKVGLFCPSHTVAYVSTLPTQQGHVGRWQTETEASPFQRGSLRGSRGSKKKISRDMISGPRGDVHHTAHVGLDGAFFGDVTGFPIGDGGGGGVRDSAHLPSLSRADSDASERAPLLAGRGGSTSSAGGGSAGHGAGPPVDHANKNPRMGYAIGYLRKASGGPQSIDVCQKEEVYAQANQHPQNLSAKVRPHEYQTIVDEDFGHLDLGPSMMDEVFAELQSANEDDDEEEQKKIESKKAHHFHDIKDFVSSTLTLSNRRQGKAKKQQATVKPIKASDEKTLEEAIAMANALASKSMHELDKRCLDRGFDSPPPISTPTSPSKRSFHFRFPTVGGGRSSPRSGQRHFSDETNALAQADIESLLTPGERDAYRLLIEGRSGEDCSPSPLCPGPQTQPAPASSHNSNSHNPLPLPPKSERLKLEQPPKRHVRKNPLIIPSGMAANVLRRETIEGTEHFDLQMHEPASSVGSSAVRSEASEAASSPARAKYWPTSPSSLQSGASAPALSKLTGEAFENAIAYSMDALDNIPDDDGLVTYESPKHSSLMLPRASDEESLPLVLYDQDGASCEDITDVTQKRNKQARSKSRGAASDEVRIMRKVLGNLDLDTSDCVSALDMTDWNVHHAIKLVKIKNLLHNPQLSDSDLKVALQMRDWDVARAANVLMKKMKE